MDEKKQKQIQEMARKNCIFDYHMRDYTIPTADVVPRAEIEELQSEIKILKDSNINLQELYQNEKEKVAKAKQKVIDISKALQSAKAEIERYQASAQTVVPLLKELKGDIRDLATLARTEAIEEFAERLKSRLIIYTHINLNDAIDDLVKEMTEDANEPSKVSPHEICETGQEFLSKKKE